jgi:hypothetical protein
VGLGPVVENSLNSRLLDIPSYRSISIMNWELMCPDGSGTTTKIVRTDDRRHFPGTSGEYVEVFSNAKAETLLPHRSTNLGIDLEPGYNFPYGQIFSLPEIELKTLQSYIEAILAKGLIQRASS